MTLTDIEAHLHLLKPRKTVTAIGVPLGTLESLAAMMKDAAVTTFPAAPKDGAQLLGLRIVEYDCIPEDCLVWLHGTEVVGVVRNVGTAVSTLSPPA